MIAGNPLALGTISHVIANATAAGGFGLVVLLAGGVIAICLYMLPTIIGAARKVVNVGSVFAINLLLGWTLIGWAVAMAMALRTNPPHAYRQSPHLLETPQSPSTPPGWYPVQGVPGWYTWWDGAPQPRGNQRPRLQHPRPVRRQRDLDWPRTPTEARQNRTHREQNRIHSLALANRPSMHLEARVGYREGRSQQPAWS